MASSKVSDLTASSALSGSELFYADDGSADTKVTATKIKTWTSASPTLVTPALGTPSAGVLSSCSAYAQSALTGLGTNVSTALGVNVGSAGAFVTFNGALGTPSSGTLTNCTLPVGGVTGLATGVGTFLATPSSANLISAVTDETGTGALVFANTPTLVTPILGTPTSGTLTNCTLPVGGVTGLGTSVATALAVNVGSAGAFVVLGGALGSPSSAGTIPAFTLGGTIAGGGNQLNNIIIGTTTPLAGSFTTMVGTSLALGGATIGSANLAVTGTAAISSDVTSNSISTSGNASGVGGVNVTASGVLGVIIQSSASPTSSNAGVFLHSGAGFTWCATTASGTADTFLRRGGAAATLQQGAADAASPVAQTTKVQGVVAGTSNTAGALWTFQDSMGTGTGASGGYAFKVAVAGSTGTAQNTYANALAIASTGAVTIGSASATAGSLIITSGVGGTRIISVSGGILSVDGSINSSTNIGWANGFATLAGDNTNGLLLGFGAVSSGYAGGLFLRTGFTQQLQIGAVDVAAPLAQTLRVQSVVAGTSNTAGTLWTFKDSVGTGTGLSGGYAFQTAASGSTGTAQNTYATAFAIKNGTAVLSSYTVANLPSASVSGAGATAFVTDASTTLILGLGGTVTGGGANKVPVYSDGTNWIYG